jgi:hypothetical protein
MVAVKAAVILAATMVHAGKSHAAMCVLTTVAMAKAVQPLAAHVLKAVAQPVVVKAAKAVKTAAATMAMNCHATLIP